MFDMAVAYIYLTGSSGAGVTFIRWGRTSCPATDGTELVYAGRVGGTHFSVGGGAADRLCLPENPDYLNGTSNISANPSLQLSPRVFGTEYEFHAGPPANTGLANHNAPCAVCYVSTRAATIMIPAKTECPSSWIREYYGYLTANYEDHSKALYNCLDVNPESIIGYANNENGALFHYAVSTCHGFECPPYEDDRALSCAVCTK